MFKLSKVQKKILEDMNRGAILCRMQYSSQFVLIWLLTDKTPYTLSSKTTKILLSNKLIELGNETRFDQYVLSEIGLSKLG